MDFVTIVYMPHIGPFIYGMTHIQVQSIQVQPIYYYAGHWIQLRSRTYSAQSPLPGEHSSWSPARRTHANQTALAFASYRVPILTRGYGEAK